MLSSGAMADTWTWEPIAEHTVITEGPAWDGEGLRYTEIGADRVWRYTPADGRREIWRESTGGANGTVFDAAGRYYACEGRARRVVRYAAGQPTEVIADSYAGTPFNEPNDLAVDAAGRIWFSDPNYGERPRAQPRESVYRADPAASGGAASGWTVTEVTTNTNRPNGVLLSADQSVLYVAESPRRLDKRRQLRAYPIRTDGSLGDYTLLHDFGHGRGVDGMCRAAGGLIVATAGHRERGPGPAVYVFDAQGLPVSTHRTPADRPTNCTFGGADLTDLYVTFFGGELYRVADSGLRAHLPERFA